MSKVDNEVKIAERLKFWEEQDQINKELIPRVVKNHEMITDLTFQFEKSMNAIASIQANVDELHNDIDNINQYNSAIEMKINNLQNEYTKYEVLNSEVMRHRGQLQELKSELNRQGQAIQEIKYIVDEMNQKSIEEKNNSNKLISIGVLCAIILSIIGIIL